MEKTQNETVFKISNCHDCPCCNKSHVGKGFSTTQREKGGRIQFSCNLQQELGSFWNKDGNYDKLFNTCPLILPRLLYTLPKY